MNRREFIQVSTAGVMVSGSPNPQADQAHTGSSMAAVSSGNGVRAAEKALELMRQGVDTLDAVIAGVNLVEEDPKDMSVGYGSLPNEEGVVQLDAAVMHGPTKGAGAVAALEGIVYPSRVAKAVMEHSDHVMLVGEGALKFALAMGFQKQSLLTPQAVEAWRKWKERLSSEDDWISPDERIPAPKPAQTGAAPGRPPGTIHCSAVNDRGELSAVTSTSGLAYKLPGRVGDSPIIGAGIYVDNTVGACGATGRGEASIKTCASFMTVEFMRQGVSPEEAALRVLQRIVDNTVEPYLLNEQGRPRFDVKLYVLNKKGQFAGCGIWAGGTYAAHDGKVNRLYPLSYLFKRG